MRKYRIKAIFLGLALFMIVSKEQSAITVLALTLLIITTGMLSLIENPHWRLVVVISYCIGALFLKPLQYGLFLIAYDTEVLWVVPLFLLNGYYMGLTEGFFIMTLSVLAYFMKQIEIRNVSLKTQIRTLMIQQETHDINRRIFDKQQIEKQHDDLEYAKIRERNRIARDIHDNVGHLLSSAIIQVGALQATNTDAHKTESYQTLKGTLDQGMNAIRKSVHELYAQSTPMLDEVNAIIAAHPKLNITLRYGIQTEMDGLLKNTFLAIIKECLNNTIKHSDSQDVSLTLEESLDNYYCIIHDKGTQNEQTDMSGIGLVSIEKRVKAHRGIFNIQTDKGYRIYVNIPKEAL